ncbi:MAG: helix-turn-helix transcriptional regulator [Polyangiaceae bacterium]
MRKGMAAEFRIGNRRLSIVESAQLDDAAPTRDDVLGRFVLDGCEYVITSEPPVSEVGSPDAAEVLTGRELQIAALVARGLLNKEIADRLHISEWTVCAHLRRIYSKLRVSTRAAMVYRCGPLVDSAVMPKEAGA